MALSESHVRLVHQLERYVRETYKDQILIYTDNPDPNIRAKVPIIGGIIPDLYARCFSPDLIILGEAKTINDIDSRHSVSQYEQYLRYCRATPHSVLIFAVPWTVVVGLKNKIRILKRQLCIDSVNPHFIEPLPE